MKELNISEYSFHEFLQRFQTAVIEGYRLDLDSNERFPQSYGSHKEVTLVLPEEEPVVEKQPEQSPISKQEEDVTEVPVKTRKGK